MPCTFRGHRLAATRLKNDRQSVGFPRQLQRSRMMGITPKADAILLALYLSRQLSKFACAAILITAGAGCTSGAESSFTVTPPAAAPVPRQPVRTLPAAVPSTSRYFSEATAIDLFEMRAAEIALQDHTNEVG